MKYAYPLDLEQNEDGTFTASFSGLLGATNANTKEEAIKEATDLLISSLSFFVDDGELLPKPEESNGRTLISIPALEAMKFALHDEMVKSKLTNKALGLRLGVTETTIRRLRNPLHKSKIEKVEAALAAIGFAPVIEVTAIPFFA